MTSASQAEPTRRAPRVGHDDDAARARPPRLSRIVAHLLEYLELYLSAAGVVVALVAPRVLGADEFWRVAAITALVVSVLHGGIFWIARHRGRLVRRAAVRDTRRMLLDRVNNQLMAVVALLDTVANAPGNAPADARAGALAGVLADGRPDAPPDPGDPALADAIADARAATASIGRTLRDLSADSIADWLARYRHRPSDLADVLHPPGRRPRARRLGSRARRDTPPPPLA